MNEVYIYSAVRTPIGSFGGKLAGIPATTLGGITIREAVSRAGIASDHIDEVFMGQVVQANAGQAPARQAALGAGLSTSVPCTTVNKVCASGMKAVMLGAQSVQLGQNKTVVTGGMENMSSIPYYVPRGRYGYQYGHGEMLDGLVRDGLANVYDGVAMGCFADATAEKFGISREAQDAYAIQSYQRTARAWEEERFIGEVIPVELRDRKGNVSLFGNDEEYTQVFFDKIPLLKPAFTKEGTVTAANASTINDGAAVVVLGTLDAARSHGEKPLARIVSYADAAQEPAWFTTAPVLAAQKALDRAGLSMDDIDFFEVNEAFSVVALAFIQHFGLSQSKVNVHGGAVSMGHPLGCSGARIVVTLSHVLQQHGGRYGLAAICNGGGGASAMIIERM
ncbi:MAG: thiolase family protein [Saprospiraceae bacterium]|jgi:acetyl-CoA C-acetyltransferase|nr:thiolase family protein [Saprospiraceae bacterium]